MIAKAPSHRVGLALTAGVVAISFAAIFFRKAAPGAHPLVVAGTRLAIASVILLPFVVRARLRGRLPNPTLRAACWGGLAYAAHFGTWVTSLTLTTVAASVTLVTATPLLLALVALVTGRDEPDRIHWVSIGLAIAGLTLLGGADLASPDALLGDGLALAGAGAMAVYLLLVRRQGKSLDVWGFMGVATLVGAIVLLGTAVAAGIPLHFETTESFLYVLLAALVPQLVGHSALTWALRHTRPTVVGIATVGEPVGSTALGWIWLGEDPGLWVLAGCTVTVVAVSLSLARKPANPPAMTES